MADKVSKVVAKPQLRGLMGSQIKRNLIAAFIVSISTGIAMKVFINEPRKKAYADFYKTYDIEKNFNEMRKKGLFDSC